MASVKFDINGVISRLRSVTSGAVDTAVKSTEFSAKASQRRFYRKIMCFPLSFAAKFGQTRRYFFDPTLLDLTVDRGPLSLIRFPVQ